MTIVLSSYHVDRHNLCFWCVRWKFQRSSTVNKEINNGDHILWKSYVIGYWENNYDASNHGPINYTAVQIPLLNSIYPSWFYEFTDACYLKIIFHFKKLPTQGFLSSFIKWGIKNRRVWIRRIEDFFLLLFSKWNLDLFIKEIKMIILIHNH